MSTAPDKRLHLAAGALAGAAGAGLTLLFGDAQFATLHGTALALVAGLAKEWRDWSTGRGTVDKYDVLYTVAGGAFAAIVASVAHAVVTFVPGQL